MVFGGSGDGFIRCSDGQVRWGICGAAGVVFVLAAPGARAGRGGRRAAWTGQEVLLQLRSPWSHEGGTWSCPGGALELGEAPLDGALREAIEEIGPVPDGWTVVGEHVFAPALEWRYTTVVVAVPERFGVAMNFETAAVEWVPVDAVGARALHPGFAAAWPEVRALIGGVAARRG